MARIQILKICIKFLFFTLELRGRHTHCPIKFFMPKIQKNQRVIFEKFEIIKLNIFSEQVFDDTTYNVISFYFRKRQGSCRKICYRCDNLSGK